MSYQKPSDSISLHSALKRIFIRGAVGVGIGALAAPMMALASPTGGQVVGGQASISTPDANSTIINQASQNAIVNWQSFSVDANQYVQFIQPDSSSVILNRVVGGDVSNILGTITANGQVFLVNPNGVFFGKGASLDVQGLLASTLDISDSDFMAGHYVFQKGTGASDASVVNAGSINAGKNGYVVLAGDYAENDGVIMAHAGHVVLASGTAATLTLSGDSLVSYAVDQATLANLAGVKNAGTITADGGTVIMTADVANQLKATVVNNSGLIEATRISDTGGSIELTATGGDIENSGTLDAGAAGSGVSGGSIVLKGDALTDLTSTSKITATGDNAQGGTLEISGHDIRVRGSRRVGAGGKIFYDPASVIINTGSGGGTNTFGTASIASQLSHGTDVTISASSTISRNYAVTIDATAGTGTGSGALTFKTTNSSGSGIRLSGLTLTMRGAFTASAAGHYLDLGWLTAGSITLNAPSGRVSFVRASADGDISITAGGNGANEGGIDVNAGLKTTASGNITLTAIGTGSAGGFINVGQNVIAGGNAIITASADGAGIGGVVQISGSVAAAGNVSISAMQNAAYSWGGSVSIRGGATGKKITIHAKNLSTWSGGNIHIYGGGAHATGTASTAGVTLIAENASSGAGGGISLGGAVVADNGPVSITGNYLNMNISTPLRIVAGGDISMDVPIGLGSATDFAYDVTLTAGGNITAPAIYTSGKVTISATGSSATVQTGRIRAGSGIAISAPGDVTIRGSSASSDPLKTSSGDIAVAGDHLLITGGSRLSISAPGNLTLAAKLVGGGGASSAYSGNVDLTAVGMIRLEDIDAAGNIEITAARIGNAGSSSMHLHAGGDIKLHAGALSSGTATATLNHGLDLSAGGKVKLDTYWTSIRTRGNLSIKGSALVGVVRSLVASSSDATLTLDADWGSSGAPLSGSVGLQAVNVTVASDIYAKNIAIRGTDIRIGGSDAMTLSAAAGDITISAPSFSGAHVVIGGAPATATSPGAASVDHSVTLHAGGDIKIQGAIIDLNAPGHAGSVGFASALAKGSMSRATARDNLTLSADGSIKLNGGDIYIGGGTALAHVASSATAPSVAATASADVTIDAHVLLEAVSVPWANPFTIHGKIQAGGGLASASAYSNSNPVVSATANAKVAIDGGWAVHLLGSAVDLSAGYGYAAAKASHGAQLVTVTANTNLSLSAGSAGLEISASGSGPIGIRGNGAVKGSSASRKADSAIATAAGAMAKSVVRGDVTLISTGVLEIRGGSLLVRAGSSVAGAGYLKGSSGTLGSYQSVDAATVIAQGAGAKAKLKDTGNVSIRAGGSASSSGLLSGLRLAAAGSLAVSAGNNLADAITVHESSDAKVVVMTQASVALTAAGHVSMSAATVNVHGGSNAFGTGFSKSIGSSGHAVLATLNANGGIGVLSAEAGVNITAGNDISTTAGNILTITGGSGAGRSFSVHADGSANVQTALEAGVDISAGRNMLMTGGVATTISVDGGQSDMRGMTVSAASGASIVTDVDAAVGLMAGGSVDIGSVASLGVTGGDALGSAARFSANGGENLVTASAGVTIDGYSGISLSASGGALSLLGGSRDGALAMASANGSGSVVVKAGAGVAVSARAGSVVLSNASGSIHVGAGNSDAFSETVAAHGKVFSKLKTDTRVSFFAGGDLSMTAGGSLTIDAGDSNTVYHASLTADSGGNGKLKARTTTDIQARGDITLAAGSSADLSIYAGAANNARSVTVSAAGATVAKLFGDNRVNIIAGGALAVRAGANISIRGQDSGNGSGGVVKAYDGARTLISANGSVNISAQALTLSAATGAIDVYAGQLDNGANVVALASSAASAAYLADASVNLDARTGDIAVIAGSDLSICAECGRAGHDDSLIANSGGKATVMLNGAVNVSGNHVIFKALGDNLDISAARDSSGSGFNGTLHSNGVGQFTMDGGVNVQAKALFKAMLASGSGPGSLTINGGRSSGSNGNTVIASDGAMFDMLRDTGVNIDVSAGNLKLKIGDSYGSSAKLHVSGGSGAGHDSFLYARNGASVSMAALSEVNLTASAAVVLKNPNGQLSVHGGGSVGSGVIGEAASGDAQMRQRESGSVNIHGSLVKISAGTDLQFGAGSWAARNLLESANHLGFASNQVESNVNITATTGAITADAGHGLYVGGGYDNGNPGARASSSGSAIAKVFSGVNLRAGTDVHLGGSTGIVMYANYSNIAGANALAQWNGFAKVKGSTAIKVTAGGTVTINGGAGNVFMSGGHGSAAHADVSATYGGKSKVVADASIYVHASSVAISAGTDVHLFGGTDNAYTSYAVSAAGSGAFAKLKTNGNVTLSAVKDITFTMGGGDLVVRGGDDAAANARISASGSGALAELGVRTGVKLQAGDAVAVTGAHNIALSAGSFASVYPALTGTNGGSASAGVDLSVRIGGSSVKLNASTGSFIDFANSPATYSSGGLKMDGGVYINATKSVSLSSSTGIVYAGGSSAGSISGSAGGVVIIGSGSPATSPNTSPASAQANGSLHALDFTSQQPTEWRSGSAGASAVTVKRSGHTGYQSATSLIQLEPVLSSANRTARPNTVLPAVKVPAHGSVDFTSSVDGASYCSPGLTRPCAAMLRIDEHGMIH